MRADGHCGEARRGVLILQKREYGSRAFWVFRPEGPWDQGGSRGAGAWPVRVSPVRVGGINGEFDKSYMYNRVPGLIYRTVGTPPGLRFVGWAVVVRDGPRPVSIFIFSGANRDQGNDGAEYGQVGKGRAGTMYGVL